MTSRLPFRLLSLDPKGETRLHTSAWDEDMLEAAGTAQVCVEVAKGYWTPRCVGVLRDRMTSDLWLSGWTCFMPMNEQLEIGMEDLLGPDVKPEPQATLPRPPVTKPSTPKPDAAFLARFGR